MARIIVQGDGPEPATLLDERSVRSFHLEGDSAMQLLERLAWAIQDAERRRASNPFAGLQRAPRAGRRRRRSLPVGHAVARASDGPFE
jgi:hypothetical protein